MGDSSDVTYGFVQRADCATGVVVLEVRTPGVTSVVVVAAGRDDEPVVGLVDKERRRVAWGGRLPLGARRERARERALTGARLLALTARGALLLAPQPDAGDPDDGEVHAAAPEGAPPLAPTAVALRAGRERVTLSDVPFAPADERALARFVDADDATRSAWSDQGETILGRVAEGLVEAFRADAERALERAATRIARRAEAVKGDMSKMADAERIAGLAQWLVAEAARAKRGADHLTVTDWSSGEPVEVTVPLDPSKSARDQVNAMFRRAKRLRLGAHVAAQRLAGAERQRAAVEEAQREVAGATSADEIRDALARAKRAAPRDVALPDATTPDVVKPRGPARQTRTPFRTFALDDGTRVLVGKGGADNDALTFKTARPHDLWLHAKDRQGAHVIVPLAKGQTCPAERLVDAAHLAAHFSDARDDAVVDVQYTPRKHLRKPKGGAPGLALVDREKVLALRVEPARLRDLLEREER